MIGHRRARRAAFCGEVWLKIDDRVIRAAGQNISMTGMLVCPEAFLWEGASAHVLFTLPDGLGPVDLECILVRHDLPEGCYDWGLKFIDVPYEVASRLHTYVRDRVQGPPPIPARRATMATAVLYPEGDGSTTQIHHDTLQALCREAATG